MTDGFDAGHVAAYFDSYGDREWDRHDATPGDMVSFAVHAALLADVVRSGDVALDAGAGPGRFTIELARLGAEVHVGDVSPVQLDANRQRVDAAGWGDAVVTREVLDICDLSHLDADSFDVVVCFGGPLSYVRDQASDALAELVRVTRPGGHVVVSVMSTLGAFRVFLPAVIDERRRLGPDHTERILTTGRLDRDTNNGHELRMFRAAELIDLCEGHGEVVAAATANFLTAGADRSLLDGLSEEEWEQVVAWELRTCREAGVRDAGTHILAALRVP